MTIRWPWVSRVVLYATEQRAASAEFSRDILQGVLKERQENEALWRQRYDALAARYHMLKLQGASEVEPLKPITPKPVDPVMAAFNEAMAGKGPKVRKQGLAQLEPVKPITPKPADPVMAAFNEAFAGKGPKVRKQGLAQLERDRAAGLKPHEIITRIHRGNRPADEINDTTTPERTASES